MNTAAARLASPPAPSPATPPAPAAPSTAPEITDDYLEGVAEIAAFLGPKWTERKVYYAREVNALPIRHKKGLGLYAFKSELRAALKAPETLPDLTPQSR